MSTLSRLNYYRRIFPAYLTPQKSQLTFWHEVPEVNENFQPGELGEYYMPFIAKADYPGEFDSAGIPLLNYHGKLGLQYNPIAIAQYGLGNYNLFTRTGDPQRRTKFLTVADWLVTHLEKNGSGMWVWNHHFDWEYRTRLQAPWYSALAQGQGISVLVRAHRETGDTLYLDAAQRAFEPFLKAADEGGVAYRDDSGHIWLEEYIVSPPTHILNGFIWASWGVYDYFLAAGESVAQRLFDQAVETLAANLHCYEAGFWSLYEQSGTWLKMLASPFYHHLHIIQLEILYRLTGREIFRQYAMRWDGYRKSRLKRAAALLYKVIFKLCYY
jgi:heparosan-N-sulfate-glucuronate 5-epimerase